MEIICVSGMMGSGKTTAATFLQKRLGAKCKLVMGDTFNDQATKSLLASGAKGDIATLTRLFDAKIGEFVGAEVERLKAEGELDYVIVEHRDAVSFKMWEEADKRIIVDVDEKTRIERLCNREFEHCKTFEEFKERTENLLANSPDTTKHAIDKMIENGEGSGVIRNNGTQHEYETAVEKCVDRYIEEQITGHTTPAPAEPASKEAEPFDRNAFISATIAGFREKFDNRTKTAGELSEILNSPTL